MFNQQNKNKKRLEINQVFFCLYRLLILSFSFFFLTAIIMIIIMMIRRRIPSPITSQIHHGIEASASQTA